MSNFRSPESRLWAQLRFLATVRLIDGRDISPREDQLRDHLTYLLVERGLAAQEKAA